MKKTTRPRFYFLLWIALSLFQVVIAQNNSYQESIESYFKKYIQEHEVVKGNDREFIRFYPVDETYKITARWENLPNSPWFLMETSGPLKKNYRIAGIIHFTLHNTLLKLPVYQSQDLLQSEKYSDYLFLPFTDLTSGEETYAAGRYYDIRKEDIRGDSVLIDFNKAYNPYCAYVSNQYNCPIPPKENFLPVAIRAGEKRFAKPH